MRLPAPEKNYSKTILGLLTFRPSPINLPDTMSKNIHNESRSGGGCGCLILLLLCWALLFRSCATELVRDISAAWHSGKTVNR